FRRRMAAQGMDINRLRSDLRNQILLQRVREREAESRVSVTEADIDAFILEKQANIDPSQQGLNLAHVLVLVPEGATEESVRELQARAQAVADRARSGYDFAALARDYSDAPERTNGGVFGMRPADRLPALFVEAVQPVPAGGIVGPFRSPAGFHVLKVLEKSQAGLPDVVVTQTRARHILLRTSPQLSQEAAVARLNQFREQVTGGQASFPALAREHSQDGSARQGGDLGWASPGQFVPEFEEAMNALRPGEISQPLVSRFGVHLIRVDERRDNTLSPREQREVVRGLVREQKAGDALQSWAQDVRSRAFVEYREAPQP
ncbi:MAG: peptidylprolyl isomerase, partial [Hydrogenophaga sp.]|nr:peptidylprolyl isomerase [Hydrogenophaga sp.]